MKAAITISGIGLGSFVHDQVGIELGDDVTVKLYTIGNVVEVVRDAAPMPLTFTCHDGDMTVERPDGGIVTMNLADAVIFAAWNQGIRIDYIEAAYPRVSA